MTMVKFGWYSTRFQARIGHLLAAAAENVVSIFYVETVVKTPALQGHNKEVPSICWDANGDHLASVSQDSAKIWSLKSGECIHELISSNGNRFCSCIFHPRYPKLLIIGAYQTLERWDTVENWYMTVQAHEGTIHLSLDLLPLRVMTNLLIYGNRPSWWLDFFMVALRQQSKK